MKFFLLSILLIVGFTNSISAETRSQGKNISDWHVYTKIKGEITKGTFDTIIFSGKKMETGYKLNLSHREATKINWEMEFTEFYAVYLEVKTTNGTRTLRYTSLDEDIGKKNGYINFGLGSNSLKMYVAISRDIEKDVEKFEAGNKLISIDKMLVRGSGAIGNIKTIFKLEEKVIENATNNIKN